MWPCEDSMRHAKQRHSSTEPILDEEEQEQVIEALHGENRSSSKAFRRTISGLALFSSLVVAALVDRRSIMVSLLSITSLVMTAFTLHYLPDESLHDIDGPLARFLPLLNGVLASTVIIIDLIKASTSKSAPKRISVQCLPLVHFFLATFVRWSARLTTRSIEELEKKRYKLKGA